MSAFKKAVRGSRPLRMLLSGVSKSGKSKTALKIATGIVSRIGGRIAALDTEDSSLSIYADEFDFDEVSLASFEAAYYIRMIKEAEQEGYTVFIIDSLSHAWSGKGGILQKTAQVAEEKTNGNTYTAWGKTTPIHDSLIDAIMRSNMHVIATCRRNINHVLEQNEKGKYVPKRVGTKIVQRNNLTFEFDIVATMDENHVMRVEETRYSAVDKERVPKPGPEWGVKIIDYVTGVTKIVPDEVPFVERKMAPGVIESSAPSLGSITPDQIAEIQSYWESLGLSESQRAGLLSKRQVSRLESLSESQAVELIAGLRRAIEIRAQKTTEDAPPPVETAKSDPVEPPPAPSVEIPPAAVEPPKVELPAPVVVPESVPVAEVASDRCTVEQHTKLLSDFAILNRSEDDILKVLEKRGVTKIGDLTSAQAEEIIAKLAPHVQLIVAQRHARVAALESATAVDQMVGQIQGKPPEVAAVDAGARPDAPPTQYAIMFHDGGRWVGVDGPSPDWQELASYEASRPDEKIVIVSDAGDHQIFREWDADKSEWVAPATDFVMGNAVRPPKPERKKRTPKPESV